MEPKSKIKHLLSFWRNQSQHGGGVRGELRSSMRRSKSQPNIGDPNKHGMQRSLSGDNRNNNHAQRSDAESEEWSRPVIKARNSLLQSPSDVKDQYVGSRKLQRSTSDAKYDDNWVLESKRRQDNINNINNHQQQQQYQQRLHNMSFDSQMSPITMESSPYQRRYIPRSAHNNNTNNDNNNYRSSRPPPPVPSIPAASLALPSPAGAQVSPSGGATPRTGPIVTSTPDKGHDLIAIAGNQPGWIRFSSKDVGVRRGNMLDSIDMDTQTSTHATVHSSNNSVKRAVSQPCLDVANNYELFDKIDYLSQHVIDSLRDEHLKTMTSSSKTTSKHATPHTTGSCGRTTKRASGTADRNPMHPRPVSRSFSPCSESSQDSYHSNHVLQILEDHDPNASYYSHHGEVRHRRSRQARDRTQQQHQGRRKSRDQETSPPASPRKLSRSRERGGAEGGETVKKPTTKRMLRDRYLINQRIKLMNPSMGIPVGRGGGGGGGGEDLPLPYPHTHPHPRHQQRKSGGKARRSAGAGGSDGEDDDVLLCPCHEISMATDMSHLQPVSPEDKLRFAASKGQLHVVEKLVQDGVSFQPDKEGRSALHFAALGGHDDIVRYLAQQGCFVNSQDNLGYTALHRAAAQGHTEVIRTLLHEGCAANTLDEHGNAALHEAAWNGFSRTVQLLVTNGADAHVYNKGGFTALHLAAQNGHNQSARALLYAGCNPDIKNNYGDTALHTAARYAHAGVTRILISARCNVSEQNKNGDTALHIAAALKRRKIAKLLLEAAIDVNKRNKQHETAIDVAKKKEYPELIALITTEAKTKKDKKKDSSGAPTEKKEKRGLFSRKKKTKDKDAANKSGGTSQSDSSHQLSSDQFHPTSSKHLPHQNHTKHHQKTKQGGGIMSQGGAGTGVGTYKAHERMSHARGTNTKSVQGVLNNYVPKTGVQYYKDLAGNVKQGPIGYAPVCSCGPALKHLEQRFDTDRMEFFEHVDTTQRTLNRKIDNLDRRTTQQIHSLDEKTRERFEKERRAQEAHMAALLKQERRAAARQMRPKQADIQQHHYWSDHPQYPDYHHPASYDYSGRMYQPAHAGYYRDPEMFHRQGTQASLRYPRGDGPVYASPSGRIYRSKSDETLSVSSSRVCRRHKSSNYHHVQAEVYDGHIEHRAHSEEGSHIGALGPRVPPTGRSPEGQAAATQYAEQGSHNSLPEAWADGSIGANKDNKAQSKITDSKSAEELDTNHNHQIHTVHFDTHLPPHHAIASSVSHTKTDSGSNPDSGYGSKIYGAPRPGSVKSMSTAYSSSHDIHNSSLATSASTCTTEPSVAHSNQSPERATNAPSSLRDRPPHGGTAQYKYKTLGGDAGRLQAVHGIAGDGKAFHTAAQVHQPHPQQQTKSIRDSVIVEEHVDQQQQHASGGVPEGQAEGSLVFVESHKATEV